MPVESLVAKVELPLMLSAVDIQRQLQISRSEAYGLIASGSIPSMRIGRLVRVPRNAFVAWIEQRSGIAV